MTCLDFEEVINKVEDDTFLFVDPPYYNADQEKFYNCVFRRENHQKLLQTLRRNSDRLRILLTYDDCEDIRDMYSWAEDIIDKEWNYCINRTDDQKNHAVRKGARYKGKEVFILNFESRNGLLL